MKLFAASSASLSTIVTSALAQELPQQNLPTDAAIPALMFFTLGAGLLLAIGSFVYFLRKKSNRDAAARAYGLEDNKPRQ